MKTKECSKCKADKPHADFHKKKASTDGLSSWCKPCKYEMDTARRRERAARMTDEERELHNKKKRAHGKLDRAVKRGEIDKPDRCEKCNKKHVSREIHGHHHDYDKPLDVEWICRTCHLNEHGGAQTLNCKICNKKFTRQRGQDHKFCSHACYYVTLRGKQEPRKNGEKGGWNARKWEGV